MSIIWAEVLEKLGRNEVFQPEDIKEIEDEIAKLITDNASFLHLPEEIWKIGELGIVPLEERLLELPLDQWIAQIIVLEKEGYGNHWIQAEKNLCKICSKDDIRYDYFNMHHVNQKIRSLFQVEQNVEKLDEEALNKLLAEFVLANINYMEKVYTQEAYSGEMEILPDYIRAACYLGAIMEKECNWSILLEGIGKSARAWKPLGKLAKRVAYFVGEAQAREEEEQNKKAEEAKDQLQKMAKQVLRQVEEMEARGDYTEALNIVRQLRQMIPEDKYIQEKEQQLEAENAGK